MAQVYLTTLEAVKDMVGGTCRARGMGPAETAAIASSVGGGVASLTTQAVIVPVDVVGPAPPAPPAAPARCSFAHGTETGLGISMRTSSSGASLSPKPPARSVGCCPAECVWQGGTSFGPGGL